MIDPRTLAAALLLSTSAAAAPVDHPTPFPVPHGLIFYPDPIAGRHAYGPADGVDVLPGGKADWTAPPSARASVTRSGRGITNAPEALGRVAGYRETRRPDLPLPPLCCRHTPPVTADTPATDHPAPVSLPASLWFILAGVGLLGWAGRR